jgi:hypothetical protein
MAGRAAVWFSVKWPRGQKSANLDGYLSYWSAAMATKTVVTSIIVVLGVVGAVTFLPDLIRYMKIRSM